VFASQSTLSRFQSPPTTKTLPRASRSLSEDLVGRIQLLLLAIRQMYW
jgi:hypothetical protein